MSHPPAFDLTGHVALVTGAGAPDGIGIATAHLLGQLGAAVAVTSTTDRCQFRAAELRAAGIESFAMPADLTDEGAVDAVVTAAEGALGPVDILVNNAGMVSISDAGGGGSITQVSYARWQSELSRNLSTQFLVSKRVVGGMVALGWGRIINMSSVTGPLMAMHNEVTYAASKAGTAGLTRALALDLAPAGITVNAVAPGWIATGSQTPNESANGAATPIGRSGTPSEIAAGIAWLASPGAAFITGQVIVIDGGNSIAEERE